MFNVTFDISGDQFRSLFANSTEPLFVSVLAGERAYALQAFSYVPYAVRVPIDNHIIVYCFDGNLAVGSITSLQGRPVSRAAPTQSQVLSWDGSAWVPTSLPESTGVTAAAGLANNSGTLSVVAVGTPWILRENRTEKTGYE